VGYDGYGVMLPSFVVTASYGPTKIKVNQIEDFGIIAQDRRNGSILGVIWIGSFQIRGLKIELGLVINLTTQAGPPFTYLHYSIRRIRLKLSM